MHDYEIRILKSDGTLTLLSRDHLSSDLAAMQVARKLRRPGEGMEIWRGEACVFSHGGSDDGLPPREAPPRTQRRVRIHSFPS